MVLPKINSRTVLILSFLIVSFSVIFSGPIWDNDFWWHLATGKYIVENKGLPTKDPFSYTSITISPHKDVILTGYWLAQIIFYLAFKIADLYGIIFLRASLLVITFILLYLWAKKYRCPDEVVLLFLIPAGWFSAFYPSGERPQLFSFLFASLTVFLAENLKEKVAAGEDTPWTVMALPIVMLLWANCHRGFPIGTALLIVYWIMEVGSIILCKDGSTTKYLRRLTLAVVLVIGASFLNPNTYNAYIEPLQLQGSILQMRITEYASPFALMTKDVAHYWPYWAYLCLMGLLILFSEKKTPLSHVAITIFLALISLTAVRYIPFLFYVTIPFTARQATGLIERRPKIQEISARIGLPILLVATVCLAVWGYGDKLGKAMKHPIEESRFPERAALFIEKHSPRGRVFNYFSWGGYLLWELYPSNQVFIDGRALNLSALSDYTYMLWDSPQTPVLLDQYGIDIIVMPVRNPFTGEFYTLINYLVRDDRWHLAYLDEMAVIFVRGSGNAALIRMRSLPKGAVFNRLIMQGGHQVR